MKAGGKRKFGWRPRCLVYGGTFLLIALTGVTEKLFYVPSRELAETPAQFGIEYDDVMFTSTDGTSLNGWLLKPGTAPKGTVIQFHGNAQNIANHYLFVDGLTRRGYQVFVFDYRGYGKSEGTPSRTGIQKDAAGAIAYVQGRADVHADRVILLGQSLGVTAMLGGWNINKPTVAGMVLDSGFTSYHAIAKERVGSNGITSLLQPVVPLLIRDGVDADEVIGDVPPSCPKLFLHGEADQVISPDNSRDLLALSNGSARLVTYPGARHLQAPFLHSMKYENDLLEFFAQCLSESSL